MLSVQFTVADGCDMSAIVYVDGVQIGTLEGNDDLSGLRWLPWHDVLKGRAPAPVMLPDGWVCELRNLQRLPGGYWVPLV